MAFGRSRFKPLFTRVDQDSYSVNLSGGQRDLIAGLIDQLDQMLDSQSPALRRLFPEPYGDDAERNAGYAVLAGAELIESRHARVELMRSQIRAEKLSASDLDTWMRTLNDLRLVIGTVLDISDDGTEPGDDSELELFHVYEHLGFILEHVVEALME
ncbi:MAG: DUF2017 family protein [Microthrixaceae bacterium]